MATPIATHAPYSFVTLCEEELLSSTPELHSKLRQAAKSGFLFLEIPQRIQKGIQEADTFARSWPDNEKLKARKFEDFSGHHPRKDQVESFYLEGKHWSDDTLLTDNLRSLASHLQNMARRVLSETLDAFDIDMEANERLAHTGGASNQGGMVHFSFNSYRPERNPEAEDGIPAHKDFGFVTILRTSDEGLEALVNERWEAVPHRDNYFVINFGRALEWLIGDPSQLQGAPHRVQPVDHTRVSYGVFLDGAIESPVFKRVEGVLGKAFETSLDYLNACFDETYTVE